MYPYKMNQVPYTPMHYPTFPPHMKPESAKSSAPYEPWPCDGSFGYPYPVQSHGCCNHNYFPGNFTMRPPYPHAPPPSSHDYPAFPGTYPVHYFPYYMTEPPRYEYNNMPRDHHCCGCPNHRCNQKGGNLKIVEEEPDEVGIRGKDETKNYPYPITWVPSAYGQANEEKRGSSHKKSEASKEEPHAWNGEWFPFTKTNQKQGEDEDQKQKQKQFPYPIYWMPYKPDVSEKKDPKEMVIKQEPLKSLEFTPSEAKQEGNIKEKGKNSVVRTIPVKQVEDNEENKTSLDTKEKKLVEESLKKQTSSPKKPPKLPPVCLRVDPLRKKKVNNGNSTGDKGRACDVPGKNSEPSLVKENNASPTDNKVKTIEVSEEKSSELESTNVEKLMTQIEKKDHEDKASNNVKEKISEERSSDSETNDAKTITRTKLSDAEAGVIIQSAFRGYQVRKWELLKKLKEMAKIKEQMDVIKNRIQALECCTTDTDTKERTSIAEMIMSLLLKLDTIQGVHPSIREIRKSVAKELVNLQESLDLLSNKNLKECVEQTSESIFKETGENIDTKELTQEDKIGTIKNSSQNEPLHVESNSENDKISMVGENLEEIGKLSEPTIGIEAQENNEEIDDSSATEAASHDLEQTIEPQLVGEETETGSSAKDAEQNIQPRDCEDLQEDIISIAPLNDNEYNDLNRTEPLQVEGLVEIDLGDKEEEKAESIQELPLVSSKLQDETCNEAAPEEETSGEHEVNDEKNCLDKGLEDLDIGDGINEHDKEVDSVPIKPTHVQTDGSANTENTIMDSVDNISPPSPTVSEVSSDRILMEENEKLRMMMEKLLEAGNKQLDTISVLSGRVKNLEKRLSRKKKVKVRRSRMATSGLEM